MDFGALLNPQAGFWQGAMDPNVLKMLGSAGARLDPEGFGGVGADAASMITARQMQEALQQMFGQQQQPTTSKTVTPSAATAKNPVSMRDQKGSGLTGPAAAQMGGEATSGLADFAGLTPQGQTGVTSMKMKPDGDMTLEFTPKPQGVGGEGTANATPFQTLISRLFGA